MNHAQSQSVTQKCLALLSLAACLSLPATMAYSGDDFASAVTGGKTSLSSRYRFERVDQEGFANKAGASTLRTQLGYLTGDFHGFSGFLQFEDVRSIGSERYNSTVNGLVRFPVVADPESTEINQSYLSYQGFPNTTLKFGRQAIIYDNHRFIGNVGWRQNEQTYDAFAVENKSLPSTTINYAHIANVNRIFGENHPTLSDLRLSGDLFNVAYSGFKAGKLVGYSYLLDYDPGQAGGFPITASNKTLGLRFDGGHTLDGWKLLYNAEYAQQSDYKGGASTVDADYRYGMLGAEVKGVQLKFNYEVLGGDGVYGFATQLATLHAHNGWADRFLNTPRDGIRDAFITTSGSVWGSDLLAYYRKFSSDNLSYSYGTEWGFQAARKMNKFLTLTVKYATYDGDTNATNVARNAAAALARDSDKLWLQAEFKL